MKTLIFMKDTQTAKEMEKYFSVYGECELIDDGVKIIDTFTEGFENGEPFDLICLDVMLPKFEGIRVLQALRALEVITGISTSQKIKSLITIENDYAHLLEGFMNKDFDTFISGEVTQQVLSEKLNEIRTLQTVI